MSAPASSSGYYMDEICEIIISGQVLEVNLFSGNYDDTAVYKVISKVDALAGGRQFFVLLTCTRGSQYTFWGLKRLASSDTLNCALARAYVFRSMPQQLMGEMFYSLHKPEKPTRFFSNYEDANKWLESLTESE
jgi:hypothetical protein